MNIKSHIKSPKFLRFNAFKGVPKLKKGGSAGPTVLRGKYVAKPEPKKSDKVADVLYRDGANFKTEFVVALTPAQAKKLKVGQDVVITKFGMTAKEMWEIHGSADVNDRHNLVEISTIRKRKKDDLPQNED